MKILPAYVQSIYARFESTSLPAECRTQEYFDNVYLPQQWLNDALIHYGFDDNFVRGIQVGMADWMINLHNIKVSGGEAPIEPIDYVKKFYSELLSFDERDVEIDKEPAIKGTANLFTNSAVLNESMKKPQAEVYVYTKDFSKYLGIGWLVGEHERDGNKIDLIWLKDGSTAWFDEVACTKECLEHEVPSTTIQEVRNANRKE